jgi:hypothetical protein
LKSRGHYVNRQHRNGVLSTANGHSALSTFEDIPVVEHPESPNNVSAISTHDITEPGVGLRQEKLEALQKQHLMTTRLRVLEITFGNFDSTATIQNCDDDGVRQCFKDCYTWAIRLHMPPVRKTAGIPRQRLVITVTWSDSFRQHPRGFNSRISPQDECPGIPKLRWLQFTPPVVLRSTQPRMYLPPQIRDKP